MKIFNESCLNPVFYLLIFFIPFAGCRKNAPQTKPASLLSYKLEASKNPDLLVNDLDGVINGNTITLKLPSAVNLKKIVVTFTADAKQITVGNTVQQSGVTGNNFESPVTYDLLGSDNKVVSYLVKIEKYDNADLALSDFKILKSQNPLLLNDVVFTIRNDSVLSYIAPLGTKTLTPAFTTTAGNVVVNGVKQTSGSSQVDFTNPIVYTIVSADGFKKNYVVNIGWKYKLPHIYINTVGGLDIVSKDAYLNATIKIEGNGAYSDYQSTTRIRGRGNTTWYYAKKPYRLKLDNAASLFNLAEEKDWVLLANYLDGTLMLNSIAMKAGKLLGINYVNNTIPVELTVNGQFKGSYVFTEQVETGANRVNIAAGDLLLEMDTNYDEPYEFKSNNYALPVMIKNPSLSDSNGIDPIRAQFQQLEDLVASASFPSNNYLDYIDADALTKYLLVHTLTDNEEINHPKSTNLYKVAGGKFMMGPIWDFDWAYDYEGTQRYFAGYTRPLFWAANTSAGSRFFSRFMKDPVIKNLFKQKWSEFKTNKFPQLIQFMKDYADLIETSRNTDFAMWHSGNFNGGTADFRADFNKLLNWMNNRATYIDNYVAGF